jgi:long-chain fatty acid transport protein
MPLKLRNGSMVFCLIVSVFGLGRAFAGGYAIPLQSAKAASLANAVTAGVDDASAVYINPAALADVPGNQFMGGLNYVSFIGSVENSGRKSRNLHDDNFIPTFFANYHLPESGFTFGIGGYAPYGLATSYDEKSFTRFAAVRSELRALFLTPAIAWRPSQYFSLGGGVSFVHSSALLSRAVFLGVGEGKLRITDTDNAYAYNLGIILNPHERVTLGLTYRSRVDLSFDSADVKFTDATLTGGSFTRTQASGLHVPLPPFISTGIHWQINPKWGMELVYDFTRWSEFDDLKARFSPSLPALGGLVPISRFFIPQDWKDTSTIRFGASYRWTDYLELRGGIAVDETPIPGSTLSPAIPGADWLAVTGGVGYMKKNLSIDLGYIPVFYKTRKVTNSVLETGGNPSALPFPGTPGQDKYETLNHFVSLYLTCRF